MSYKFEDIKGKKYAIHTTTQKAADNVYEILKSKNYDYYSKGRDIHISDFGTYHDQTVFCLDGGNLMYSSYEWAKDEKLTIITAEEFIRDNTEQVKFKENDWVEWTGMSRTKGQLHFKKGSCWSLKNTTVNNDEYYTSCSELHLRPLKPEEIPTNQKVVYTKDNIVGVTVAHKNDLEHTWTFIESTSNTATYRIKKDSVIGYHNYDFINSLINRGDWVVINQQPNQEDEEEIKVGDEVECIESDLREKGIGWKLGKTFIVKGIDVNGPRNDGDHLYFSDGLGVYQKALRKVVKNNFNNKQKPNQNGNESKPISNSSIKLQATNFKISEPIRTGGVGLKSSRSKIIIGSNSSYNKARPFSCKA